MNAKGATVRIGPLRELTLRRGFLLPLAQRRLERTLESGLAARARRRPGSLGPLAIWRSARSAGPVRRERAKAMPSWPPMAGRTDRVRLGSRHCESGPTHSFENFESEFVNTHGEAHGDQSAGADGGSSPPASYSDGMRSSAARAGRRSHASPWVTEMSVVKVAVTSGACCESSAGESPAG